MRFADLLYPKDLYCQACGRPLARRADDNAGLPLCDACLAEMPWAVGRTCAKCGKPLADENLRELCRDCARTEHAYRRGYACVRYVGLAAELVRDMKYRDKAYFADGLAAMMARRYAALADPADGTLPDYDGIVAVPMGARKRARRGYDQAALVAASLARRIGVRHLRGALVRGSETAVMSSLGREGRLHNLSGAIRVGGKVALQGKTLLLVDDVYTTGATADACAEALYGAGAASVDVYVFATGADGRREKDV